MGNCIRKDAAVDDILVDLRRAFTTARLMGSPTLDDAARYLGEGVALADDLATRGTALQSDLTSVRVEQRLEADKCDALISQTRDTVYNTIGRPRSDALFGQIFPDGIATYTNVTPEEKPIVLEVLAVTLLSSKHPLIPAAFAGALASDLRAAAARLSAVNARVAPILATWRVVQTQTATNARQSAIQIARLKKFWKSMGMSEHDIHGIIPDRPQGYRSEAATAAQASLGNATPPANTVGPVPPAANVVDPKPAPVEEELEAAK
jgi:hypothetical protein